MQDGSDIPWRRKPPYVPEEAMMGVRLSCFLRALAARCWGLRARIGTPTADVAGTKGQTCRLVPRGEAMACIQGRKGAYQRATCLSFDKILASGMQQRSYNNDLFVTTDEIY
jgi:hypothetical protein